MSLIEPKRHRFGSSSSFFNEFQNLNKIKRKIPTSTKSPTNLHIHISLHMRKQEQKEEDEGTHNIAESNAIKKSGGSSRRRTRGA